MNGSIGFTQPNLTAGGNIAPKRFLKLDGTNFQQAIQATNASVPLIGVSDRYTRFPPGSPSDDGYIAVSGDALAYRGPLSMALLTLGGTVTTMNTPLTADADGKGVAQAPADGTTAWYGAFALQDGVAGDDILVYVLPPTPTV